MYTPTDPSQIETLCNEIMNSPYLRKHTPVELKQLQAMLEKVSKLAGESAPQMIAEIKYLRNQNKKLLAELETHNANKQAWAESTSSTPVS